MYPKQAKEGHVPSLGIFLAVEGGVEFPGCILTLVNQRKPLQSVSKREAMDCPSHVLAH